MSDKYDEILLDCCKRFKVKIVNKTVLYIYIYIYIYIYMPNQHKVCLF